MYNPSMRSPSPDDLSIGKLTHTAQTKDSKPRIVKIQAAMLVGSFGTVEFICGS